MKSSVNHWDHAKLSVVLSDIIDYIDGLVQELLMHWSYVFLALTHRYVLNLYLCKLIHPQGYIHMKTWYVSRVLQGHWA